MIIDPDLVLSKKTTSPGFNLHSLNKGGGRRILPLESILRVHFKNIFTTYSSSTDSTDGSTVATTSSTGSATNSSDNGASLSGKI